MKRIHVAQWRLTGPTEGTRVHKVIHGPQVWQLNYWLQRADGHRDDYSLRVDKPCALSALMEQGNRLIAELTQGTPTVTAGGWDAFFFKGRK